MKDSKESYSPGNKRQIFSPLPSNQTCHGKCFYFVYKTACCRYIFHNSAVALIDCGSCQNILMQKPFTTECDKHESLWVNTEIDERTAIHT